MKVIVVGTNHCWGRAETLSQALKNAFKPKYYVAWMCSDETTVTDIDGSLQYPVDAGEPVLIDRVLPKEKRKKTA